MSWSADLISELKWWQRVLLAACLCALALSLWFPAKKIHRYFDGQQATTVGYVDCDINGGCRGVWRLSDGQQGRGEIEGLGFEASEELVPDIPLYAGRDWAVADWAGTDGSKLVVQAVIEFTGIVLGTAFVLFLTWIKW
ncbi:hypothetical protein GCM10014715_89780 [Streptomyces spiralis]|uniref:Uncharacterized protein n=1 Tax=Streptomyces spiralis TaxID=66376 RepID=A0A919AR83_9ACTN|nr:hypothetical protein [Streptomyces spiralis]GHF21945.1 hypothetical protein GCM10014715_89780 [Streptomyces spiralis]